MSNNKTQPHSMRLDRLLSNLGYGGRKEMAMAVKNEWVDIDGETITNPSLSVPLDLVQQGRVTLDGEPLDPLSPFTIMLHKPEGYTCSHKDPAKIVYDLLPEQFAKRKPALSIVGRLDKYSTGQLLFSDDGALLHRVTHPKTHALKYYHVEVRDDLSGNESALFASGDFTLPCEEKPLKPAQWEQSGAREGTMVLSEGRNRQIRRMFDKLGNEVLKLHRFKTGNLPLGDLKEGKWRVLENSDLEML